MKSKRLIALVMTGILLIPTAANAKGKPAAKPEIEKSVTQLHEKAEQDKSSEKTTDKQEQGNIEDKSVEEAQNEAAPKAEQKPQQEKGQKQEQGTDKKEQAQTDKANKQQEIQTFKQQIKAEHATLAALRQQIIPLVQEVGQKKDQLETILEELQSGEKTLPPDMLNALMSEAQNLKGDGQEIDSTSDANSTAANTEAQLNSGDFGNAVNSLSKVIAKFQARLAALQQLNKDLDAMLLIANQATTPLASSTTTQSGISTTSN